MSITVRVNGLDTIKGDLLGLTPAVEKSVLRQMSQLAYDKVQEGADRHTKTGALYRSVFNREIPKGREVGHDPQAAPHALFVVFGTRPHKIQPKTKKALRWAGPNGFRFAKFVNHPGYAGDDYMQRAADDAVRQFDAIVNKAIQEQK